VDETVHKFVKGRTYTLGDQAWEWEWEWRLIIADGLARKSVQPGFFVSDMRDEKNPGQCLWGPDQDVNSSK